MTQQEAEQDARAAIEPRDYDGKLHAQQAALRKLQRKYDTVKGDLRVANERAAVAVRERDQAQEALRRIAEGSTVIDYDTPSLAREIARAALAVGKNATEGET